MKNSIKRTDGFTSLTFTIILGIFMTLYFTAAFSIALAQQKDYVRSQCISHAADIQGKSLQAIRSLFYLNAESTFLRVSIKSTKIAIAAAAASLQYELIPPLERALRGFETSQQILDLTQKALILRAQIELHAQNAALTLKINKEMRENLSPWQRMIFMVAQFRPKGIAKLAIRPDSEGGVAPNYEWQDKAEQIQKLAYSWNVFFRTKHDYQSFLEWMNVLSIECSVAPDLRERKWKLKISVDK